MGKKLITFSVWGQDETYLQGALENAKLAQEIYPGWTCRFYVCSSTYWMKHKWVQKLLEFDNVSVVLRETTPSYCNGSFWRFEPMNEEGIDVMISRDTDSRLSLREKAAVDEWLESPFSFHVMRDHPYHNSYPILAGLFGIKKGKIQNIQDLILKWDMRTFEREYHNDQDFLATVVGALIEEDCMGHDSFGGVPGARPFPTPRENLEFVGASFDSLNHSNPSHDAALKNVL